MHNLRQSQIHLLFLILYMTSSMVNITMTVNTAVPITTSKMMAHNGNSTLLSSSEPSAVAGIEKYTYC